MKNQKNKKTDILFFYQTHLGILLVSVILTVLLYYQQAFSLSVQVDTETLINGGHSLNWLQIGRFGLHYLQEFLTLWHYDPFFSGFLMLIFFSGSSLIWVYLFYYVSGYEWLINPYIFLAVYMTSPIWASQFYFSLQQAGISLAFCLLSIAVFCQFHWFTLKSNLARILSLFLTICLLVLVFSCYQAFVAVFAVAVSFCLLLAYRSSYFERDLRKFIPNSLLIIAIGIISLFIYFLLLKLYPTDGYLDGMSYWDEGIRDALKNLYQSIKSTFHSYRYYYGPFIIIGLISIGLKAIARREETQYIIVEFLLILIMIMSNYLMFLYLGGTPLFRAQLSVPLFTGAFLSYAFKYKKTSNTNWRTVTKGIIACSLVFPVMLNAKTTLSLFYADEMRDVRDRFLAQQINQEIQKISSDSNINSIFIYGKRMVELNPAATEALNLGVEMFPSSDFYWDWRPESPGAVSGRGSAYINAVCGTIYVPIPQDKVDQATQTAITMPSFPKDGSVIQFNDYYIVKLSD